MHKSIRETNMKLRGVCNRGEILEVVTEISIEIRDPKSQSIYFSKFFRKITEIKDHVNLPCATSCDSEILKSL